MLKLVETAPVKKKIVPQFYAKVPGGNVPAVWRRTEASLIHATTNGRTALCEANVELKMGRSDDGDLSRNLLTCNDCAELVFRVKSG